MDIYWSSIELKPQAQSEYFDKYKGGFVYIFLMAEDVRDVIKKITVNLNDKNLDISKIEFVSIYEDIPWDSEEEQNKYDSLALKARNTNQIEVDDLYLYEKN